MPAQSQNSEQTTRDRRGLGNDGAIYLDVIDLVLKIGAIGLSIGEIQLQDEQRNVESRSGRKRES